MMSFSPNFARYSALRTMVGRLGPVNQLQIDVVLAWLELSGSAEQRLFELVTTSGLSQSKFTLLLLILLEPRGEINPTTLAQRSGLKRASVTELLDGLSRQLLIHREPGPTDRRTQIVSLTEKGQTLVAELLDSHFVVIANWFDALSNQDTTALSAMISAVSEQPNA